MLKRIIVYQANTLADPWAVMIEFLDTVVANSTVTAPWWPKNLANSTVFEFEFELHPINLHTLLCGIHFLHTSLLIPGNDSWIHCADQDHVSQNLHTKIHIGKTSSNPLFFGVISLIKHQFEVLTTKVRIREKVIMRVE